MARQAGFHKWMWWARGELRRGLEELVPWEIPTVWPGSPGECNSTVPSFGQDAQSSPPAAGVEKTLPREEMVYVPALVAHFAPLRALPRWRKRGDRSQTRDDRRCVLVRRQLYSQQALASLALAMMKQPGPDWRWVGSWRQQRAGIRHWGQGSEPRFGQGVAQRREQLGPSSSWSVPGVASRSGTGSCLRWD